MAVSEFFTILAICLLVGFVAGFGLRTLKSNLLQLYWRYLRRPRLVLYPLAGQLPHREENALVENTQSNLTHVN